MIRAIIVDDEQPSIDKLEKLLNDSGKVKVAGKFRNPIEALDYLKKNTADAVFLDIEMPEIDGIELSNQILDLQGRIAVVFVTAYNQYAVEAFRINALDFLMKPVTAERLKETLKRIVEEKGISINTPELRVQCFGKFKVSVGNSEVKFRTEKAEELLAFLTDRRGSFVGRNEIIDSLWEDYEGDRALTHFNTTLHYVKKALIQHGVNNLIEFDRGSYKFDSGKMTCDYCRFYEFTAKEKDLNKDNISEFEEIIGLYSGDYLSGKEYPWVERSRQMMKDRFILALLELSEYYRCAGIYKKAMEALKRGLVCEPLHREINYKLIDALLQSNDRYSAREYFDMYKNSLRKKLKQEPDEAFRRLMR